MAQTTAEIILDEKGEHMTKYFLAALIPLLLFSGTECKKNPVVPQIDTTSQSFSVLRIDTLGTLFSFADGVDIVDENNIWVAGIFTERDTNGEILYNKNLAHWNGTAWEKISVPMYGYNNTGPTPEELVTVKVFSNTDIFVTSKFNSQARWDGGKWTSYFVDPQTGYLQHVWGRSSNDIYIVGEAGRAAYYNGQTFTKINTGLTNPPLIDVWGDENAVYAVGQGNGPGNGDDEQVFISGDGIQWKVINFYKLSVNPSPPNQYMGGMLSVFRADKNSRLWILAGTGGGDVYEIESLSPFSFKIFYDLPGDFYPFLIRGTADNDLYITNQLNSVFCHYNGVSWYKFDPAIKGFLAFDFAVKDNTWVTVGSLRNGVGTAMVVIGKHN